MLPDSLSVPLSEASDRMILLAVLSAVTELESRVSELEDAVADLHTAVSDIAGRIAALVTPLQQALSDAQTANATLTQTYNDLIVSEDAEDVQQNADLAAAQAAVDDANARAMAAADEIHSAVSDLDQLAQPAPEPAPEEPTV